MFLWWHFAGVLEVAVRGYDRGDIWILEFVWVSDRSSSNAFPTGCLLAL